MHEAKRRMLPLEGTEASDDLGVDLVEGVPAELLGLVTSEPSY